MPTINGVKEMRKIHNIELAKLSFWFNVLMGSALVGVVCIAAGGVIFAWSQGWSITLFVFGSVALAFSYLANSRRNYWNDRVTNRLHKQLSQIFSTPSA